MRGYLREAADLLAARADDLAATMRRAARLAYAIGDGTLIPIDQAADQHPYYPGTHNRHGVKVQVRPMPPSDWPGPRPHRPGAIHDLTAARAHGLIDALTHQRSDLR